MESILNEIDEGLRNRLAEHSMQQTKLKQLDNLLVGHGNHVLTTYIFWLLERTVTKSTPQDQPTKYLLPDSQLQSWCDRLRKNHGLEPERIFDALCTWTRHPIVNDIVDRVHLHRIREDILPHLFHVRRPKSRKPNDKIQITVDQVPASLQCSREQPSKLNDNEEYLKAAMHSNKKESNSLEKSEVPSDADSEVETLGWYQEAYQHHSHSTTELPLVVPMQMDSCQSLDRDLSEHDTTSHSTTYADGANAQAPKRWQVQETEDEATRKPKEMSWTTIEHKSPHSQPILISSQPEAAFTQDSQRHRNQAKKNAKPHDEYLCYRCEVAGKNASSNTSKREVNVDAANTIGHFLQDCPTNLDPAFDKIPVGGYKCMICGKTKAHLTSLCPDNTDPKSLTQLRLKLGTVAGKKSNKDETRPVYGRPESSVKNSRSLVVEIPDNGFMNEDRRRAMLELDQEWNDQLVEQDTFESRYLQAKRTYSRRQSQQDDQFAPGHVSPPFKRLRHDRKQDLDRDLGRTRDRTTATRNNDTYTEPSELLASLDNHRAECGRLSYWDSEDQLLLSPNQSTLPDHRPSASSFSTTPVKKQALPQAVSAEVERLEEIRSLFPHADSGWVNDMAEFDLDRFFKDLDSFEFLTASDAQT